MASDTGQRNTILLVGAAVLGLVVVDRAFNGEVTPASKPTPVASPPATKPAGPKPQLLMIRAEREVRAILRDPESAKFSDMSVRTSPAVAVCGYVNSKNGFGGMTGKQRFISGAVTAVEDQLGVGEMDELWGKVCG
ncbi:hypothetical protein [Sphingomonas faeni]|uniref:hypothetical protein n=1 Tax=Sphingomonas faeni TaxID=185950 RepID=UPI0033521975